MNYLEAKNNIRYFGKDSVNTISNFDAASKLLNSSQCRELDFRGKLDLFFLDY